MATYYWLGRVSSDVMNKENWSVVNPIYFSGISGTTASIPHATTIPAANDNLIFDRYGITGTTFVYPIYPPSGTMGISGGSTAAFLKNVQIFGNYHVGIGTGNTLSGEYFNVYAENIKVNKNASNGTTFAYKFNLLQSSVTGASLALLSLGMYSNDSSSSGLYSGTNVLIKGRGHVRSEPQSGNISSCAIYFGTTFSGKIGPFTNPKGSEFLQLHSGISLDQGYPMKFSGARNLIWISEGFKTPTDSHIELDGTSTNNPSYGSYRQQQINFIPKSWSGISGGITAASIGSTSVEIKMYGAAWNANPYEVAQSVAVNHPVDFRTLELSSGRVGFGTPYEGTSRVFQGLVSTEAWVLINYQDIVTFLAPGAYSTEYTGTTILDYGTNTVNGIRNIPFAFTYGSPNMNYKMVFGGDDDYWNKQFG